MKHQYYIFAQILLGCLLLTPPSQVLAASWTQIDGYALTLNPEAASHIRHLVATKYAIYGLSIDHKLLRFPLDGFPPTEETLPGRVIDISVDPDGQLWVVTVEELSHNIYVLVRDQEGNQIKKAISAYEDEYPQWRVSAPLLLLKSPDRKNDNESVYTIAAGDKLTFVLTNKRLAALDQSSGEWKTEALDHPFDLFELENPISLVQGDRWVWYGTDAGEFGGRLIMADFRTGETSEPWDSDPVTAIVPIGGGEHCVLFAVGLAHLGLTNGGIYKTCGDKPQATFTGHEPIWDLITSKTDLFALTQGALVPIKDNKPDFGGKIVFPPKIDRSVAGLPARLISDVLVLYTGARWEVSTSGLTPYAISLPSGADLKLQPYPLDKKHPSECVNSQPSSSEDDETGVQAWEKDSVTLANGDPGVEFTLKGWDPNGEVSIYGIDSACRLCQPNR
jgi:hypothetical protein